VAGQHDAAGGDIAVACRQCREQVGLAAVVVERQRRRDAEAVEIPANPVDQRQVRIAARRVVGDQCPDQVPRDEIVGAGDGTQVLGPDL